MMAVKVPAAKLRVISVSAEIWLSALPYFLEMFWRLIAMVFSG
jgi:hypothetical protein